VSNKLSDGDISMSKEISNQNKRWVEAPKPTQPMMDAPAVLGVNLALGEDVEWFWTHTDRGSYVSGYNIVKEPRAGYGKEVKRNH
jgi:hypothetical protein